MTRKTWNFWDYNDWIGHQVLRWLPIPWVSGLAVLSGNLIVLYVVVRGRLWFRRIATNISKLTGEQDPKKLRRSQTDVICNVQRAHFEFALLDRLFRSTRFQVHGSEHIVAAKKPIVFVGAHLGNWELQIQALVREGLRFSVLYEPPESPSHLRIAMERREGVTGKHVGIRWIASSKVAMRELIRTLDKGDSIWMAIDELKHDLVWGPALGRKLPYAGNRMMAARLAIRAGATVIPVRSRRLEGTRFEVSFGAPLEVPMSGDPNGDARALADRILDAIEPWVLEDLTQWYLMSVYRHERPVVLPSRTSVA